MKLEIDYFIHKEGHTTKYGWKIKFDKYIYGSFAYSEAERDKQIEQFLKLRPDLNET